MAAAKSTRRASRRKPPPSPLVRLPDHSPDRPDDKLVVRGGARLRGTVDVAGSTAAALPLLAASLLVAGPSDARTLLRNVPDVGDVRALRALLASAGVSIEGRGGGLAVLAGTPITRIDARSEPIHDSGSVARVMGLLLGALAGRGTPAFLAIGARVPESLAQSLAGLRVLGAVLTEEAGGLRLAGGRLRGGAFAFGTVSTTATHVLMLAAALARGRSTLENCSAAPEVEELGRVLNKMGGRVHGAGTPLITIEGVEGLDPIEHTLLPDRIEAGTLMLAAAITRGDLLLRDCLPEHLQAVVEQLRATGTEISAEVGGLRVRGTAEVAPADIVVRPHPGFPRALAAPLLVFLTRARGPSVVTMGDGDGFGIADALGQLGADLEIAGQTALVRGPQRLRGAKVTATEPSGAAALVLAGLVAEGSTEILRIWHLDRGYERLDRKLKSVGAEVRRARATPTV